jgi:hypothetical protein
MSKVSTNNQPLTKPMLVPMPWAGLPKDCPHDELSWVKELPNTVYLNMWLGWPTHDLPPGYDSYIVSFHLEAVDTDWVDRQCQQIQAPIIVLHDGSYNDWPHADNLYPICYYYYHNQVEKIHNWHGKVTTVNQYPKYLASAYCSRISQSKLIIFTALSEYIDQTHTRLTLSDWLEPKNVHYFQPTGNTTLDQLTEVFWKKYFGQTIKHDDYNLSLNYQQHTSNYQKPEYRNTALHFTNESFHYSLMGNYVYPGPFVTEKTLKCLVAGQAFVPVGQFDTYGHLGQLGFEFDYGFDTSWDKDPGNISRLESLVKLIKELSTWSAQDIIQATIDSTRHNLEHVNSGNFAKICQSHNDMTINKVLCMLQ